MTAPVVHTELSASTAQQKTRHQVVNVQGLDTDVKMNTSLGKTTESESPGNCNIC